MDCRSDYNPSVIPLCLHSPVPVLDIYAYLFKQFVNLSLASHTDSYLLLKLLLLQMFVFFLSTQVAIKQISSDRVQQWARLVSFSGVLTLTCQKSVS